MAILIKGAHMPVKGFAKDLLVYGSGRVEQYDAHGNLVHTYKGTAVEVPEKHRLVDADKLMMSLADWWYSSFGEKETDESKAVKKVLDEIENRLEQFMVTGNKKQEAAEVQM